MSRDILDANLRLYIALGTDIHPSQIIKGLQSDESPDGLFASLFLMNERTMGHNTETQYIGETDSFTVDQVYLESMYSLQFYRAGALDAASRFIDWSRSQTGRNWASTAITDGRIKACNVYAGGSGYISGAACTFIQAANTPSGDEPTTPAAGVSVANDRGELVRVVITNFGAGYYDIPTVDVDGAGRDAVIAPRGFGFSVANQLTVRNIPYEIDDEFQERAQIDLKICHTRTSFDYDSGRVEQYLED